MIKHVSIAVLTVILTYLAFSFVAADINPFNWNAEDRFLLVFTASLLAFAAVALSVMGDKSND